MTGSSTPTPTGAARATTQRGVLFGVLVVSSFVMLLNETILSVGLRTLSVELDVTTTTVQWVTSGFLLTMAVVIPTTGYLLDRFPARRIYLAAMGLFCLGTLAGALAPGFGVLLGAWVVQACGTAVVLPLLATLVMRLVEPGRRGAMMGLVSLVIAFAPALPDHRGRGAGRTGVAVAVPRGAAARPARPGFRLDHGTGADTDSAGAAGRAVGAALGGRVRRRGVRLSALGEGGARPVPPWVPIAVGVAVLVLFVLRQLSLQRRDRPLLDLRPFGHRIFVVGLLVTVAVFVILLGVGSVLLPLHLQSVLGQGTFGTGLAVLPGGLVVGALGRPSGRLYDRFGARAWCSPERC